MMKWFEFFIIIINRIKRIRLTTSDKLSIVYFLVLLIIVVGAKYSTRFENIIGFLVIVVLLFPLWMSTYFKVYNSFILSVFVCSSAASIFKNTDLYFIRFAVGMTLFVLFLLLLNIILVIIDLYSMKPKGESNSLFQFFSAWAYKYRYLYIVIVTFLLVVVVLLSFSFIYLGLQNMDSESFKGKFNSMYLSFTTFFTVGYGDIVPESDSARAFVMGEMFVGFLITTFAIPLFIVAILDLIRGNKEKDKL